MQTIYDAAIDGAGPGGSNAAAVMLRGGLRVIQFDAATFPRAKPCGGGMTIKACRALLMAYLAAKGIAIAPETPLRFEAHQIPVGGFALRAPRAAPVYIIGVAGGFADALSGEGIYHALESGRLAGITAVEHAHGRGTYRRYYRRRWRAVLSDTLLTYLLSRFFYQHINLSVRVLQHPLVWRPFVEGYASGATFAQSLALAGYFQAASLLRHSLAYERV